MRKRNNAIPPPSSASQRVARRKRGVTMGSRKRSMLTELPPAAISTLMSNPTFASISGAVEHPEHGEGIRVHGHQLLTSAVTTAADTQLFSGGTATATANYVRLSPDKLNGRLALLSRNYSRYVFRHFRIYYNPRVATSQAGAFAVGFVQDGFADNYATATFETVLQMVPAMLCAFREKGCLEYRYKGSSVYFTEADDGSSATIRQTDQGVLLGYPDATSIGALTQGQFWIEYLLDLYQPTLDFGFSVALRSQQEKEWVQMELTRLRARESDNLKHNDSGDRFPARENGAGLTSQRR